MLRAACAGPPTPIEQTAVHREIVTRRRPPDAGLTIVVAVVDGQNPQVADTMRATATVLGVSAGAVTAEQLARVAASAAAVGRDITGILVADPDPTTARPAVFRSWHGQHRRRPTRMAGTKAETRR